MIQSENIRQLPSQGSAKRRQFSRQEREQHLQEWQESGLSAHLYAAQNGLKKELLYFWKSKMGEKSSSSQTQADRHSPFVSFNVKGDLPFPVASSLKVTVRHGDTEYVIDSSSVSAITSMIRALKQEVLHV